MTDPRVQNNHPVLVRVGQTDLELASPQYESCSGYRTHKFSIVSMLQPAT